MKIRRKLSTCQNCGTLLDRKFNFCPECGQENDEKIISFSILFKEFIDTFFALDSSFLRTLRPFILKPGFLTLQFFSGKRKSFANPIRLYLIISIFYFFTIGIMGRHLINSSEVKEDHLVMTDSLVNQFEYVLAGDSLSLDQKKDLLSPLFDDMTDEEQMKLLDSLSDKSSQQLHELGLVDYGSFSRNYYNPEQYESDPAYRDKMARDTTQFILNRINTELIKEMDYKGNFSDKEILDSMQLSGLKWWEEYLVLQSIRVERNGDEAVTSYIVQNMSVMMLLVIPVFAIILKVVYIRRKILYVQHLIHALHLHSFAYLFYGIANLILIYWLKDDVSSFLFWLFSFVSVSTYAYMSFLKVYKQGWLKTIIKFNLVGYIYVFTLITFFVMEAGVSFLLF